METSRYIRRVIAAGLLAGLGCLTSSAGQVILDHSLGQAGQSLPGPDFNLTPSNGRTVGNNLFFSFSQFDLASGDTATFAGPNEIQNILSRVTGGQASSIDGTIRSTIPGANFYLINPQGILFGPNAKLDVSGSFAASTADYLKLADGVRFVAAVDANDSILSSAAVSDFGFLGGNSGRIELQQSTLAVPPGNGISLAGGNVVVDGATVQAPAGQISVASVQSAGEVPVSLAQVAEGAANLGLSQQGEIKLQNASQFDASGEGGGRIVIRGGSLLVDSSKIQANSTGAIGGKGIDISVTGELNISNSGQINSASPDGLATGGNIRISAQTIRLDGGGAFDENFNPTTQISTVTGDPFLGGGPARGGDITIQAGNLELVNSAQIASATFGAGDAGRIEITADTVKVDALAMGPTQITANTQAIEGGGNAGDIVIRAKSFDLRNSATILAASFGSGRAGVIDIHAPNVSISSGAIVTAGTFGAGEGGNVQITADNVRINGEDTLNGSGDLLTGIQAVTTSGDAPAPGGSIQVNAGSLELSHMGSIFTTSYGLGPGGNITIQAGNLSLASAATIRASGEAMGSAGTISAHSAGQVVLSEHSSISTSAPGSSGGDISVSSGSDMFLVDSQFIASAGINGGNVTVAAPGLIYLLRSTFTGEADAAGGLVGNGGNLSIEGSFLILNHSGLISKSVRGNGGNITIDSDFFFKSDTLIDATAPFGLPGTVVVTAPETDLSGALVGLPESFLDAGSLLRPDCGIRLTGNISSFIVLGRGGMPLEPSGYLPSSVMVPVHESK